MIPKSIATIECILRNKNNVSNINDVNDLSNINDSIYKNKNKLKNNDAFIKLRKIMSQITIIVIRVDNNGKLSNSRPCIECIDILKMMNIKYVCYSDDTGNIIEEKVKYMESNHFSAMARSHMRA